MPSVITIAGTLAKATSAPFTNPRRAPKITAAITTIGIGIPGTSMKSRPVRKAVSPMTEPTERSTLRVMMTIAWPTATSTRIDGVSSRSRHPSALNRKFGFFTVAATTTRTRAAKMPSSRARPMPPGFFAKAGAGVASAVVLMRAAPMRAWRRT